MPHVTGQKSAGHLIKIKKVKKDRSDRWGGYEVRAVFATIGLRGGREKRPVLPL